MLASTRSNPGQKACAPGRCQSAIDVLAVQRPPAEVERARRSRPRPRTCGRSGARSRPGRAARAPSRRRRRGSSRTRCRRSRSTCSESALAPVAITISSNTDQPRHWSDVQPGRQVRAAPPERRAQQHHRRARARRRRSGRRAPSIRLPTTAAATIAPSASGSESARPSWSAGSTRNAPATITSSETDRFAQSRNPSNSAEHAQPLRNGLDSPAAVRPSSCCLPSPA